MADRTRVSVYCRQADREEFEEALGLPLDTEEIDEKEWSQSSWLVFSAENEIPTAVESAIPEGKPYMLIYLAGNDGGYGAAELVHDGIRSSRASLGHDAEGYVIHWSRREADLKTLEAHMTLRDSVLALLGMPLD